MQKFRALIDCWHSGSLLFIVGLIFLMTGFVGCGDSDHNSSSDDSGTSDDGGTNDDGSDDLNNLLDGTYALFTITDDQYNQENDVDFDGEGGLTSTIVYDSSGDTGEFSGTYTVETTGEATIDNTDSVGIVAADGGSFSLVDTILSGGVDDELMLGVGVKKGSGMTNADLVGTYVIGQFFYNTSTSDAYSSIHEFEMDGAGAWTGETTYDSDGGAGTTLAGTYTVSDDGRVTITITGLSTKDIQGRVSADGNLLVLIDEEDPNDDEVAIFVGLKTTTGADGTLLSGDYQLNTLGMDETGGAAWASRVDATADGAGALEADVFADSDDDTGEYSLEYTVDADGTMEITTTGEHGIVSSDGEVFIIVDTDATDNDVMLGIGLKKS